MFPVTFFSIKLEDVRTDKIMPRNISYLCKSLTCRKLPYKSEFRGSIFCLRFSFSRLESQNLTSNFLWPFHLKNGFDKYFEISHKSLHFFQGKIWCAYTYIFCKLWSWPKSFLCWKWMILSKDHLPIIILLELRLKI